MQRSMSKQPELPMRAYPVANVAKKERPMPKSATNKPNDQSGR